MSNPKYCHAQADFCVEMAEMIKRPDYRDWWLSMAQEWRELAEEPTRSPGKPTSDHSQGHHYHR